MSWWTFVFVAGGSLFVFNVLSSSARGRTNRGRRSGSGDNDHNWAAGNSGSDGHSGGSGGHSGHSGGHSGCGGGGSDGGASCGGGGGGGGCGGGGA